MNRTSTGLGGPHHFSIARAYSWLTLGVLSFAWAGIFVKLCGLSAPNIAAGRMALAVLLLAPFAFRPAIRGLAALNARQRLLLILAGLSLGVHFAVWVASLSYTSVASSVILATTNPVFVSLGSRFILKEPPSRWIVAGLFLAAAGAVCVAWSDAGTGHGLKGDLLALAGAVMFSAYLLAGRYLRGSISTVAYTFPIYLVCATFLLTVSGLLSVFRSPPVLGEYLRAGLGDWLFLLLLAVVPTLIGHSSLNWVLRYISSPVAAMAILGEPVLASILAFWILDEGMSALQLAGGGLILVGVFLALARPGPVGPALASSALTANGPETMV